ncbi:NrfD/PsrC family molybdoenzyme membrane anchor subunit [Chloroflexota bacterium]
MHVKPWEWMVKPTPQEEWIEGKGLLSWLSFFSVALGAGMYFVAVILNYPWAMVTGYLVCLVIGGGTKMLDLGKPSRAWRMLLNYEGEGGLIQAILLLFKNPIKFFKMLMNSGWKTSWISRGMFFIGLFTILGLVHIILTFVANTPASTSLGALGTATGVFSILMIVVSVLVAVYAGLLIGFVKAIPLWGSALMPVFFVASGFLGGAALALAGRMNNAAAIGWLQIMVLAYVAVVIIYLWNAWNQSGASRYSVRHMIRGGGMLPVIFYVGVVVLGILWPVATVIISYVSNADLTALLAVAIAGVLIGDLSMRYLIMKCGTYTPLIPTSPY